jgi:hypothetical protein
MLRQHGESGEGLATIRTRNGSKTPREAPVARFRRRRRGVGSGLMLSTTELQGRNRLSVLRAGRRYARATACTRRGSGLAYSATSSEGRRPEISPTRSGHQVGPVPSFLSADGHRIDGVRHLHRQAPGGFGKQGPPRSCHHPVDPTRETPGGLRRVGIFFFFF